MTESLAPPESAQVHRRRRFTWRLALAVSVALLAAFLAWFVSVHLEYRRQCEAIAAIERLGGDVMTRSTAPLWLQHLQTDKQLGWRADEGLGPNWLREFLPAERILNYFEVVVQVSADNGPGIHGLSNLTGHRRYPKRIEIADDDLAHLTAFPQLKTLWLRETGVADAGLRHLRGLKHLKELHLDFTRISDNAAETLAELEGLEILSLLGTRISDKGLARLMKLPHLKTLNVKSTQVTEQAIAPFRSRPGLDVYWSAPGEAIWYGG